MTSCLLLSFVAAAQKTIIRDAEIESMVKEISADSLKSYINTMVTFGTRNTLSTTTDKKVGIGAAREWVVQKFKEFGKASNGRLTAYVDTTTLPADGRRVNVPTNLGNAMAILKGTDPTDDRIYLISGHLDSRVTDVMNAKSEAPGANDDGSGVAAVMECARIMSKHSFPATIIFVAVSGEEQGLLGATFLANNARAKNWNIDAVLNNDIMGSNNSNETNIIDNTRLRVFSEAFSVADTGRIAQNIRNLGLENDGRPRQLARYVKEVGERYMDNLEVVMIYRNDRFLRGGDHTPFVAKGYAAVRLTEMNENYNHQHQDLRTEKGIVYGDLPEFMDFEYLRKNTGVNLAVLANLAKAPAVPQEVKIETRNLTNTATLNWKAPKSGAVKGYYILMRETTSPVWQKKIFTAATTITLPYSKDNYFFAVQSVNATENESLPVVPTVGR
ncbi:MAG: peptidase [Flaviaesturariibacter sp.]|nr:peptidase [Flaviaesturariibacter sp.]